MRVSAQNSALQLTALAMVLLLPVSSHSQQAAATPPANSPSWFPSTWRAALSSPLPAIVGALGGIGPVIPENELTLDPTGFLGTYQPSGPTVTAKNAFFQSLGTNGRTCATCHQPGSAMGISTNQIKLTYLLTGGTDPLFAPVDGANCPNQVPAANTGPSLYGGRRGTGASMAAAHSLVLNRGVFRIFLPAPSNSEFTISVVSDPTTCNTTPAYNSVVDPTTGAVTQIVSVFRRPRISTNLSFVTNTLVSQGVLPPLDPITGAAIPTDPYTGLVESGNIMWDGREPTLQSQAIDATLNHSQALTPPTAAQVAQMVQFETGLYSAQSQDFLAGNLSANGALGGPANLSIIPPAQQVSLFSALGFPRIAPYDAWASVTGSSSVAKQQESIYRGQQIFNSRPFTISNVSGFNNIPALSNPLVSSCGQCHNQIGVGNDSFANAQHDIGVGGQDRALGGPAPSTDLPIFKLTCTAGHSTVYNGSVILTNDPALALITGKCADIGRSTMPQLRGLASRAPYFRDGSAKTLLDVVNFYNQRFNIGFSAQDKVDLVNFLNTL